MSASGRSSDTSRKLLFLLLSLFVIAGLFTAIIALMLVSQGSADERRANSTVPANTSGIPAGSGPDLANSTTISGITRSSLGASLALLQSINDSAAWLSANPDWRLFMAQADYTDSRGLAKHWSLILRSANGSLVAYVDSGSAVVLNVEDNPQASPQAVQALMDSTELLGNVTVSLGIDVGPELTPFELLFSDDGGDGIYRLSYHDPADEGKSFAASYNARTGEAIEG